MPDHHALGRAGAARGEDDQGRVAQQRPIGRCGRCERREVVAVDVDARLGATLQAFDRGGRCGDMDRHRDGAGAPDAEQGGEIGRSIADPDMDGLAGRNIAGRECGGDTVGQRRQRCRRLAFAAGALDRMGLRGERVAENPGQSTAHEAWPGKRASRQASAALRPSRRAISMNSTLSGEPAPSIARSIASASSSASSMLRAS